MLTVSKTGNPQRYIAIKKTYRWCLRNAQPYEAVQHEHTERPISVCHDCSFKLDTLWYGEPLPPLCSNAVTPTQCEG
jgi:NAD-dependent SIR2 family protein deacetylase